jgi:heme exporter protein B
MQIQSSTLHKINLILQKELKTEFRSHYAISALLMFSLTTLSVISMSIGNQQLDAKFLAILFWIILFFSAMAGLSRVFLQEQVSGTIHTLRAYGTSQPVLFGKFIYNFLLLNVLTLFLLPLFIILLNVEIYHPFFLLLILLAGNAGIAIVTTLTASMIIYTQSQTSLFTILSFPIILPLFLLCIQLTETTFNPNSFTMQRQLLFVGAYDMVLIGVASILFDYIWYD